MAMRPTNNDTMDQILSGLKLVAEEAQRMLGKVQNETAQGAAATKERFSSTVKDAQSGVSEMSQNALTATRGAAHTTERYVTLNPWKAVGVGALVGIAVGMIIGRK